jgi:hypothetical protein
VKAGQIRRYKPETGEGQSVISEGSGTGRLNAHQQQHAQIAGLRDYSDDESSQRRNAFSIIRWVF